MSFVSPVWLWSLVLPGLLVLLHLLHGKRRLHQVSSARLWHGLEGPVLGGRMRRVRLDAALLLGLMILTGLALAGAGPWRTATRPDRALAVVIDCSPSMAATVGSSGVRRIDVAREVAMARLREAAATPQRLLVLACETPRVVPAGAGEERRIHDVLMDIRLSEPAALGSLARAAAAFVRSQGGGRVLVISDFSGATFEPPLEEREGVAFDLVAVGEAADNIALTSLRVARAGTGAGRVEAVATIENAGPVRIATGVRASVSGAVVAETVLSVPAGETVSWPFVVVGQGGVPLEVRIAAGGALTDDDVVETRLPGTFDLRAADGDLPRALSAAIEVITARAPAGRTPVAVFQHRLPERLPHRWLYLPARRESPDAAGTLPVVIDVVDSRAAFLEAYAPVLAQLPLPEAEPPPGASLLALAAGKPALALFESETSRGAWWGLPLEETDLPGRGVLPLVLRDMLDLLERDPAPGRDAAVLTDADLHSSPPASARDVGQHLEAQATAPAPLRRPLLGSVLLIVLVEGARRVRGLRRGLVTARPAPAKPRWYPVLATLPRSGDRR